MNPYRNHSDAELVQLLRAGDRQAFETIYHRFAKALYSFARKNIKSKEDCEEILQDVFEKLWLRHEDANIESLQHYLFTSIRYKVIRYFQHKKVIQKHVEHFRWFELAYESADKSEFDPQTIVASINHRVESLPDRCRIAIQLRIQENLSNSEIADRMKINKRTVELYISQAFRFLRQSYDEIYKLG